MTTPHATELSGRTATTTVEVRYFAAARAAAGGVGSESVGVPSGSTVGDLLAVVRERHGAALARVLERCSYLLDEVAVRDLDVALPERGATLDVLPPFAGG